MNDKIVTLCWKNETDMFFRQKMTAAKDMGTGDLCDLVDLDKKIAERLHREIPMEDFHFGQDEVWLSDETCFEQVTFWEVAQPRWSMGKIFDYISSFSEEYPQIEFAVKINPVENDNRDRSGPWRNTYNLMGGGVGVWKNGEFRALN